MLVRYVLNVGVHVVSFSYHFIIKLDHMKLTLVLAYPFHYRIICTNVHFFFEESFYKFVSVALYTVYLCSLEVVYVSAIQTSKCI
jgi:hypothetical protein